MERLILKAATIVTMDDRLGDFDCADPLVENGEIAATGPHIGPVDAETAYMRGRISIPGLANVEVVMAAGRWRKREGRLLVDGLPAKLGALARSGRRIAEAAGISANLAATRIEAGDARTARAGDVQ
jgi:hypothetical protein